ncbi:MAG: hypothetical protein JXB32_20580 [Deltaproteobacteria bacterium]|nr:hypothetical protein [Deltaproteobacteria bacterium]
MEPTSRPDRNTNSPIQDDLGAALARDAGETREARNRLRRLADSLAPCLADGRCEPGFARTADARAFAALGREVAGAELHEHLVRERGLSPSEAEAFVRGAEDAAARGAEIALRDELVARLREARELLPQLAADPTARTEVVARLLSIPDGPGRLAALRELGLAADPAGLAADLREHEARQLLREQLARDPAGFLADAQARLDDPSRAAALAAEVRAAVGSWNPFDLAQAALDDPVPIADPLTGPPTPWDDDGGWDALQQALCARPILRALVGGVLQDDSLRRIDQQLCDRAAELAGAVDAALSLVLLGERADSPLVLLRDGGPALVSLVGEVGEDSLLARGVERRIAEREDEYATWATIEWAVKLGARVALSFGPCGLLGGVLGAGAGVAAEASEAAWAGDVLRGLAGIGALDYGRLAPLRTADDAAGDAAREGAWDLLFNLAHLPGLGVLLDPGEPRHPLAPTDR